MGSLLRLMLEQGKGLEAVELIRTVSMEGRALKQTPTLTALALCCQLGDAPTKKAAYDALPAICRTPTHLFELLECCEATAKTANDSSGWGRAHRRAIVAWYNGKKPAALLRR